MQTIGSTIRKWDEDNHVSQQIGNAFSSVATTTGQVFDRLFPNMGFTQPQQQEEQSIRVDKPISEDVYNSLPVASIVPEPSPVEPSTQDLKNEVD